MVPDTPNSLDLLLPDRHPQPDFFICDVADAVLKDLMPTMEHPFYALSKKPDTAIRRYEHEGKWLEVTPSVKGQATTPLVTGTLLVIEKRFKALPQRHITRRGIRSE